LSAVTFVSRLFGLMREWVRGYLLGTSGSSDAFALAFMFPNLMRRLVGEGALIAAFVPVISDYKEDGDAERMNDFLYSFFTAFSLLLLVLTGLALLAAPLLRYVLPEFTKVVGKIELTVLLTRLMFPYMIFISLAALLQGILNVYKVFIPSAVTPILLNIAIIAFGLLVGGYVSDPSVALGYGVLVGGTIQLLFQWPFVFSRGIRVRFRFDFQNEGVRKVFGLMLPAALGAGVNQFNALISQFITATLQEGSVAALRFSITMIEMVLGIFVISITTVILPLLSEKSSQGDLAGMKSKLLFALRLVFLVTLPAGAGLFILRTPLIGMLFRYGRFTQQSVDLVSRALLFHSLGLAGIGANRVLIQMFYSLKDTRTPVYLALVTMALNIGLAVFLKGPLQIGGIALAGTISSYCYLFLLQHFIRRKVGGIFDRRLLLSVVKSLAASVCMAVGLSLVMRMAEDVMARGRLENGLITLGLILLGIVIFIGVSVILKNGDIVELRRIIREKLTASR
jgi:putative peptidoglycan lipid II flippase